MDRHSKFLVAAVWLLAVLATMFAPSLCIQLRGQNTKPDERELIKALNEKLTAARAASKAGDFDTAIRL